MKVYGLTQLDAYRRDEERQNRLATSEDGDLFPPIEAIQPEVIQEEPVYLKPVDPVKIQARKEEGVEITTAPEKDSPSTILAESVAPETSLEWSRSVSVPPIYASTTQSSGTVTFSGSSMSDSQTKQADVSPLAKEASRSSTTSVSPAAITPIERSATSLESKEASTSAQATNHKSASDSPTTVQPSQSPIATSDKPAQTRTTSSEQPTSDKSEARTTTKKAVATPSLVYRSAQQATASPRRNDSKPQVVYTHAHNTNHQPNESIYGTIMKRLLALEVNATLSTGYLEEQSRVVRETFRRIEDRLSNMEKTVSLSFFCDRTIILMWHSFVARQI